MDGRVIVLRYESSASRYITTTTVLLLYMYTVLALTNIRKTKVGMARMNLRLMDACCAVGPQSVVPSPPLPTTFPPFLSSPKIDYQR